MADKRNVVVRVIQESLTADGWRRSGESWYKNASENQLAINLQKSDYSRKYWLNLSIFLPPIPAKPAPYYSAPIRMRADALPQAESFDVDALLDLELPLDESLREDRLKELMKDLVLANLNKAGSVADLESGGAARAIVENLPGVGEAARFLFPDRKFDYGPVEIPEIKVLRREDLPEGFPWHGA
jgi:hypothetical protein